MSQEEHFASSHDNISGLSAKEADRSRLQRSWGSCGPDHVRSGLDRARQVFHVGRPLREPSRSMTLM